MGVSKSAFAQINRRLRAAPTLADSEALEDAPGRRISTSNAFYVAISRFLNGFITVNAVYALLSGSNEH